MNRPVSSEESLKTNKSKDKSQTNSLASVEPHPRSDSVNSQKDQRSENWNTLMHDCSDSSTEYHPIETNQSNRRRSRRVYKDEELISEDGIDQHRQTFEEIHDQNRYHVYSGRNSNNNARQSLKADEEYINDGISKYRIDNKPRREGPEHSLVRNVDNRKSHSRTRRLFDESDVIDKQPWSHDKYDQLNVEVDEYDRKFERRMYSDRREELARQMALDSPSSRGMRSQGSALYDDRADSRQNVSRGRSTFPRRPRFNNRLASNRGGRTQDYNNQRSDQSYMQDYPKYDNDYREKHNFDDRRYTQRSDRRTPIAAQKQRGYRRDNVYIQYERNYEYEPNDDQRGSYRRLEGYNRKPQGAIRGGISSPSLDHTGRTKSTSERSEDSYDRTASNKNRYFPSEYLQKLPFIPQTNRRVFNVETEKRKADSQGLRYSSRNKDNESRKKESGSFKPPRFCKPTPSPTDKSCAKSEIKETPKKICDIQQHPPLSNATVVNTNKIIVGSTKLPSSLNVEKEEISGQPSKLSPYASPFCLNETVTSSADLQPIVSTVQNQTILPFGSEVSFQLPQRAGQALVFPHQQPNHSLQTIQPNGIAYDQSQIQPLHMFNPNNAMNPAGQFLCYAGQGGATLNPAVFAPGPDFLQQHHQQSIAPSQTFGNHMPIDLIHNSAAAQYVQRPQYTISPHNPGTPPFMPVNPTAAIPYQAMYSPEYFNQLMAQEYAYAAAIAAQVNQRRPTNPNFPVEDHELQRPPETLFMHQPGYDPQSQNSTENQYIQR